VCVACFTPTAVIPSLVEILGRSLAARFFKCWSTCKSCTAGIHQHQNESLSHQWQLIALIEKDKHNFTQESNEISVRSKTFRDTLTDREPVSLQQQTERHSKMRVPPEMIIR